MARPRKDYPFEDLRIGRKRKFTRLTHTPHELVLMVKAVYRRRYPDGSPRYQVKTKPAADGYEWIEVQRIAPASEGYD